MIDHFISLIHRDNNSHAHSYIYTTILVKEKTAFAEKHTKIDRAPRNLYRKMDAMRNVAPYTTEKELGNDRPQRQRLLTALSSMNVSSIFIEAVIYRAASVPLNKVIKDTPQRQQVINRLDYIAKACTDFYNDLAISVYENNANRVFQSNTVTITALNSGTLDEAKVFTLEHIQYFHTNVFGQGPSDAIHNKYPLWKSLLQGKPTT
ncbi:predicted protein [Lichtheimia corymbifera JMRC:FSU:9682]|uniref:Uncharacterized protein n=1 Tax=Lichtheimia corymbifera JMRC:FSU:9682 TaxID=1263082 RepID=A0A068RQJ1_9FUNG|nr:predicted protein [Lichtheimia corymbifera JMRC:FSU:9682]